MIKRASRIVPPEPELPQCSETLQSESARDWRRRHGGESYQCPNRGRFLIDDKPYCARHAGALALKILMEN